MDNNITVTATCKLYNVNLLIKTFNAGLQVLILCCVANVTFK